jgi:hypothetical protein
VLLAWLKESGVYGLLNATNARLPEELRQKQAKAVALLVALKENGTLDALIKRQANGAVSAAGLPAAPIALPALPKLPPLKAFNLSRSDLLKLPKLPGNASSPASDKATSAVLLAWLRDSGVYSKLEVLNKAIGNVQSTLAGAAANATAKLESALHAAGPGHDEAKDVAKLQVLLTEVQSDLHTKLNEVNEAFTDATKKVCRQGRGMIMAAVRPLLTSLAEHERSVAQTCLPSIPAHALRRGPDPFICPPHTIPHPKNLGRSTTSRPPPWRLASTATQPPLSTPPPSRWTASSSRRARPSVTRRARWGSSLTRQRSSPPTALRVSAAWRRPCPTSSPRWGAGGVACSRGARSSYLLTHASRRRSNKCAYCMQPRRI